METYLKYIACDKYVCVLDLVDVCLNFLDEFQQKKKKKDTC